MNHLILQRLSTSKFKGKKPTDFLKMILSVIYSNYEIVQYDLVQLTVLCLTIYYIYIYISWLLIEIYNI